MIIRNVGGLLPNCPKHPEDSALQSHRCENLKPKTLISQFVIPSVKWQALYIVLPTRKPTIYRAKNGYFFNQEIDRSHNVTTAAPYSLLDQNGDVQATINASKSSHCNRRPSTASSSSLPILYSLQRRLLFPFPSLTCIQSSGLKHHSFTLPP
jgi:hypothetical protein